MATVEDIGCAVGPEGNLKDASDIQWYHDKDDDAPIATAPPSPASKFQRRRGPIFFFKKWPSEYHCWLPSVHSVHLSICSHSRSRECNEWSEAKGCNNDISSSITQSCPLGR